VVSRLEFAPLGIGDLPFLLEVRNECRNYLHDDREFTLAQCREWYRTNNPQVYVIRLGGARIGYFRLGAVDHADHSVYVGADLHRDFRGKGLGLRAYVEFLPWIAGRLSVSWFKLEVLSHNSRAQKLYAKLGFVETGRRKAVAVRDGLLVDSIVMERRVEVV
jgi:RimJ/RimL family protein N-acetyltransferase